MSAVPQLAPAFRRILVPFDGSDSSLRALDEAVAIAGTTGAALRVLTVFDPMQHVNGFEPGARIAQEEIDRARAQAAERLSRVLSALRTNVPQGDARLVDGHAGDVPSLVAAEAAAWGADLVVAGTRGLCGVERFMLGSVAEDILRRSGVPVMLVRPEATGKASEHRSMARGAG